MPQSRPQRFTVRLHRSERSTLEAAAALRSESVSATLRRLALGAAREEIRDTKQATDDQGVTPTKEMRR